MRILLTGGIGYIGSHIAVVLNELGHNIVMIDNLSNSKIATFENLKKLTSKSINFFQIDLLNKKKLNEIFKKFSFDAVVHLASLKSVSESLENPLKYYQNNFIGTFNLIDEMLLNNVNKIVFSSSATVYGTNAIPPINEETETKPTNPYGEIKLNIEKFLESICIVNKNLTCISLRYFNPVGAHSSGLIGESPLGKPNNLMPIIMNVAAKKQSVLKIFGNNYETKDGTCVRDFIHVMDVAEGHINALNYIQNKTGYFNFNLGTGKGISVLELKKAFENFCSIKIPFEFKSRRSGDVAISYANPDNAKKELNWTAKRNLKDICVSGWKHKLISDKFYNKELL